MTTAAKDSQAKPTDPAIRAVDLAKAYGANGTPVQALRGVSLEVRRGERIACVGKSGSGKSTLLNLLGGLDQPTSGRLWVAGLELGKLNAPELAQYRLRRVGMIFQAYNLIPSRTALQNVELPMIFAGLPRGERRTVAREALQRVGLGQRLDHLPNRLSGGEQQRVAIARALVNRSDLLLADEPTGNLDSETARDIGKLLLDYLQEHGITLILVTHDEELAGHLADRVLRLKDGQVIGE
jgi:ABC-type lipoprotein export system ATPase subunit